MTPLQRLIRKKTCMKRLLISLISIAVITSSIAGCAVNTTGTSAVTSASESSVSSETTTSATTTTETTTEATTTTEARGHFEFKPIVIGPIFKDYMGEDMYKAYCNYVNAVRAGEDSFEVKDEETYDWMIGQFPSHCYPLLGEYTESNYAGAVKKGRGTFQYKISKEEFAAKSADFEKLVTNILNENLRDDYSDFEKVLALYIYFSENYSYDYDTYYEMNDHYVDNLSPYRFLTTGHGICSECGPAFSYLLLQAGVQADCIGGNTEYSGEGHSWSYVTINGNHYHVDATYAMQSGVNLSYLMMTDERREKDDGYKKSKNSFARNKSGELKGDRYDADDDFFAPLKDGHLISWDHDKKLIYYTDADGNEKTFDYSPFA